MDFKVTNTGTGTIEDYGVVLEEFYIAYENNGSVKNDDGTFTNVTKGELTTLAYPDDMKLTITCKSSVSGKICAGYDSTVPTTNDILAPDGGLYYSIGDGSYEGYSYENGRPLISLKSSAVNLKGNGTQTDPYVAG